MTQKGYCKICEWQERHKWHKEAFQKEIAEGRSLRHMQTFLRALGLHCDIKTISKHLKLCENLEVKEQRNLEKVINKAKNPFKKLGGFFKPQKLLSTSKGCEHIRTTQFYDIACEQVFVRCLDCGIILGGGIDPEENERRMNKDPRNVILYNALRKVDNA